MKPGRELDQLIAENVFGHLVSNGFIVTSAIVSRLEPIPRPEEIRHYSTDPSAAEEVVRAMVLKPLDVRSKFFRSLKGFAQTEPLGNVMNADWIKFDPLEVCSSALKAVGQKVDQTT